MRVHTQIALVAATFLTISAPAAVSCQPSVISVSDQHAITQLIRSSKHDDRADGVGLASLLEPSQISEELRLSLLTLFKAENKRLLEDDLGKFHFDKMKRKP